MRRGDRGPDPAEPTDQSDRAELTEQGDRAEPTEQSDPAEPTEQSDPAEGDQTASLGAPRSEQSDFAGGIKRLRETARSEQGRREANEVTAAEDIAWMQAFQRGDERAFARLVERHERAVYAFCLRMLGEPAAAEDALQEVFLRVVKSAARYRPTARFTTFLFTIARNHCLDFQRKARHRKTTSLDRPLKDSEGSGGTVVEHTADERSPAPDRGIHSAQLRVLLEAALAELSEEQREVFLMRQYGGLPFKEIAEVVGVPENTVKSRMRYALGHLRAELAKRGVTPETL